jgi:hypothetical protein
LRWIEQLMLPTIANDEHEARAAVESFDAGLAEIERGLRLDTPQQVSAALDAVLGVVTFQLHYLHGEHTALQRRFGALVERVVARAAPGLCAPVDWQPLAHGGRLRIGFVSPHLHVHSVARFFASWITDLDRTRFESLVWHCGSVSDEWTAEIAAASDHFEHASTSLGERIRAARLDVLILLDIGLDPRMQVLAAMRLAPRQYTTFGHPVTSGLSTLDGFLSAELLEGEGSGPVQRAAGASAWPRHPHAPARAAGRCSVVRELAGDRPVLLCLQNLIKLQPAFDAVLARCVRETGAMLVFFELSAGQIPAVLPAIAARVRGGWRRFRHERARRSRSAVSGFSRGHRGGDPRARLAGIFRRRDEPGCDQRGHARCHVRRRECASTADGRDAKARWRRSLIARDADDYVRIAVELCGDEGRRAALRQRLRQTLIHCSRIVKACVGWSGSWPSRSQRWIRTVPRNSCVT